MNFLNALIPGFIADGKLITESTNEIEFVSSVCQNGDDIILQSKLINKSGHDISVNRFCWQQNGIHNDALTILAKDIRVFCEGWSMASPSSSRRFGDRDFKYNPDYLNSAIACKGDYVGDLPNHFRFEYVTIIRDASQNSNLLAGFITSANQFCGGRMTLCEHGVDFLELTAYCDDCILPDGKELLSEKLLITTGNDDNAMLCHFAQLWGSQMNAKTDKPLPLGWCSWYFYFDKITENDMIANADYILANRNDYPLNLLQLDDGYQSACGDWLQTNEKFPHGLKWLADEIKRRGLTAGLWLAPFFAGQNSELYKNHPDWVVKNAQGEPIKTLDWRDGDLYALDGTHPEVQKHLSNLFRTIREIGFDYVKLDFMISACNMPNGKYYDSTATRAQALRRGLQAIREGFGDDGYILGCTVPFGPTIGLVDGNRISTDITPYWTMPQETNSEAPTVPNVCRNNINHTYMHRRLWINDPDTLIVRKDNSDLTENESKLWCDAVNLAGGSLMLSDSLPTLENDRADWTMNSIRNADAYETFPADRMEHSHPMIWMGTRKADGQKVMGLFNLTNENMNLNGEFLDAHKSKIIEL